MGDLSMQNSEWFDWMDRNTKASLFLALPVFMSDRSLKEVSRLRHSLTWKSKSRQSCLVPFALGSIWYASKSKK